MQGADGFMMNAGSNPNVMLHSPSPGGGGSGASGGGGSAADVVNVRDFGAVGDGSTDDSRAFRDAVNAILNRLGKLPEIPAGGDGANSAGYKLYVPPGTYRIVSPKVLMPDTFTGLPPTQGIVIEGAGPYMSTILFAPRTPNSFLMHNNNEFLYLTIRDIAFVSATANANFMYSYSRGFAQRYRFDNVAWGGDWTYGFHLEGTNNNSEMTWVGCSVTGRWNTFFHVPQSVGMTGDQFVNYNFLSCHFEVNRGNFLDMAYGGSVNVIGGSYMIYGTGSPGGTLFTLRNSNHQNGTQRFLAEGLRVELKDSFGRLIDCSWGKGTVTMISVDTSVQQWNGNTTGVGAVFDLDSNSGPSVAWINCSLQGKHEYKYAVGAHTRSARILYQNCEMWHYNSAADFIVTTNKSGRNTGGAPLIKFDMCRGRPDDASQNNYLFDTTLNWHLNRTGHAHKQVLHLGVPGNGGLPNAGTTVDAWLPKDAVITNVRLFLAPGAVRSSSRGWQFRVRTSESTPATLAVATPENNIPSQGFNVDSSMFFVCDSDAKRHIVLSATGASGNPPGMCVIEYLA